MFSNGRKTQALQLYQFTCKISKFRNTVKASRYKRSTKLSEPEVGYTRPTQCPEST